MIIKKDKIIIKNSKHIIKVYFDTLIEQNQILNQELNNQKIINFPNLISAFNTLTNCYNQLLSSKEFNDIIDTLYQNKDFIIKKEKNIISPTDKVSMVLSIYQSTNAISQLSSIINKNQQLIKKIMEYKDTENFIFECDDQFGQLNNEIADLEQQKEKYPDKITELNLQISEKEKESQNYNDILMRTNALINLVENSIAPVINTISDVMTMFATIIIDKTQIEMKELVSESVTAQKLFKKQIEKENKNNNDSNS